MPLTHAAIAAIKPAEKTKRYFDERGLYLEVSPAGGRYWRLKYRVGGGEKRMALGVYPEVTLKEAREARDEARKLVRAGVDPGAHRRAQKQARAKRAADSFEVIGREWFAKFSVAKQWVPSHSSRILAMLERDVFPYLGRRPIAEITAADLLPVVQRVEGRTLETAHRVLSYSGQIFRYGVATLRCTRDPTGDLRGFLAPVREEHFAATLERGRLGEILAAMYGYKGSIVVESALKLAPLLFVRPGELRSARWRDVDFEAAEWRYQTTKTLRHGVSDHIVPLARQAIAVLRALQEATGEGELVFPGERSSARPMSDNAVLAAMRNLAIGKEEMTGHGFRAVARTLLDEELGFAADVIEHQLAHAVKDPNGRAYNRTTKLKERHRMMQAWADYLDELRLRGASRSGH